MNGPLETLTSAPGALGLAIAALLLVVGFRFLRPERGVEWAAAAGYAAALVISFAAGSGLLGAPPAGPGAPQRLAGAAVLVGGLLLAGAAVRVRHRARAGTSLPAGRGRRPVPMLHAGLALVLLGHLLRTPSRAGAAATAAALVLHAWAGLRGGKEAGTPSERGGR